ncbi:MAG: hypothetical protein JW856_01680 [Dehalococcoidales bacterium]|nr:hypothetical protein [Dehalococcoidales bacterium]
MKNKKNNNNGDELLKSGLKKISSLRSGHHAKQPPESTAEFNRGTTPLMKLLREIRNRARQNSKSMANSFRNLTASKIVTLNIEGNSIKLLEVRGKTVKKWARVLFEPGKTGEGNPDKYADLGVAVKKLMNASGINAKNVVFSTSGLNSISRIIPISPETITTPENIRALINETMPLTEEQLYLSWKIINTSDGERQIYITGIVRDEFDSQIRSLKKMGINPGTIEYKPIALSRAVNKKDAIVLNVEPASFDVIIVANSIPTVSHTTPWQPDSLEIADQTERLALTMELSIDFHNSHYPENMLETPPTLYITGKLSADTALIAAIEARTGYNIEPLTIPMEFPPHFPASQYTTNIGLALRGGAQSVNLKNFLAGLNVSLSKKPSNNQTQVSSDDYESLAVNLLPKTFRPWRPTAKQVYTTIALIIAVGLIVPFFQATADAMSKTFSLEAQYNNLNNELERRKAEIKKQEPIQAAINNYKLITSMAGYFTADLEAIYNTAEALGITVLSINHEGQVSSTTQEANDISVNCSASDYLAFREFATALLETGRFTKVTLPEESYPFTTSGIIKVETKATR